MNDFPMHLRDTRKLRRLTQEELAEKADISRVMISRYETGAVIPTVDVLIALADALDISIDYLLGRRHYASTPDSQSGCPALAQNPSEHTQHMPVDAHELRQFILNILSEYNLLHKADTLEHV